MKKKIMFLAMMALCLCASARVSCPNIDFGHPLGSLPPNLVRMVAVTHNSATLVWHGPVNQYEYVYIRSEHSSAMNLVSEGITVDDTVITLTDLRSDSEYSFYVRSRCGQSVSSWSQAISFKTCSSETSLPYSQNFESCGVGSEASLPPCWFAYCIEVGVDTAQPDIGHVFPITSPVIQGKKSLAVTTEILEEGNSVRRCGYAVMPLFSGSSDHYMLYFDGRSTNINGTRILVALTDSPKTASSFVPLDTLSFNVAKENYEILLDKKRLNNRYILFLNLGPENMPIGSLDTAIIDNVSLMSPSPYCPYPYIHRNIKPTSNSATITWEGKAGQYEVKWKKLRDFVWSDPAIVKEQSFGISELEPGTSYHVWVRAICNDSLRSEWASVNFKTLPEEGKPEEPKTCPVPVNFHLVDVGMYNATFDWTPVGNETSWEVKVWNKDGSWTKTADYHPFTFGTDARSDIMRESDDLHRCKEYMAAVHPICDMGWEYIPYENWEYSQPIAFKSQCCPDVENLRIGSVRETAVWLEWEGRTNNYDVMLADITDPLIDPIWEERIYNNGAGTFPDPNASQTRSFWLDDLLPYRKYEIWIRSECNDGTHGEYAKVIVETPPYILTEAGVDILQIGKPFTTKPPKGSIYDAVKLTSRGDNGGLAYNLLRHGESIGTAFVHDGSLISMVISYPSVCIEGGIFVNTPIVEAFMKRNDMFSECTWDDAFEETLITLNLVGENNIYTYVEEKDLSPTGRNKYKSIDREGKSTYPRFLNNLNELSIKLMSPDFNKTAKIKDFRVGTTYFLCW
ncbi:MAG: fibronectin type III domain-containing protein [Bacteroidales bacterium]|nr:fibronectin type III domain-containing protein [Bacteroidales bacterium]